MPDLSRQGPASFLNPYFKVLGMQESWIYLILIGFKIFLTPYD